MLSDHERKTLLDVERRFMAEDPELLPIVRRPIHRQARAGWIERQNRGCGRVAVQRHAASRAGTTSCAASGPRVRRQRPAHPKGS
jgi:hypothetical protein